MTKKLVLLAAVVLLRADHAFAQTEVDVAPPDRDAFHFVLCVPVGVMNGFDSHRGQAGTGLFDLGYSDYTSSIYGFGISLGLLYEAERFGIGGQVSGFIGLRGASAFGELYGLFYIIDTSTAPFIGGGFGYQGNSVFFFACDIPPKEPKGSGPIAEGQIGVEFSRHSRDHLRVQLALEVLVPFYADEDGSSPTGILFNTRVAF